MSDSPDITGAVEHASSERAAPSPIDGAPPITYRFPRSPGRDGDDSLEPNRPRAEIEVVACSHLPTSPGPWLEQYAASVADATDRPVALVSSEDGDLRIDVIGADAPSASALEDAADAVEAVARVRPLWVIRGDDTDASRLATHQGIARLTLLAGAGEPAVISAYRVIKSIAVERAERDRATLPGLRVAVMGVDREEGERVARTLHETASTFLDEDIELAGCIERIAPTSARRVYEGQDGATTTQLVAMILAANVDLPDAPPRPRTRKPPAALSEGPEPNLAELCDLVPLDITPPDDPDTLLAHDELGRIHVLVHDAPEPGLMRVMAAQAWASLNATLIARAAELEPVDDEPVAHLFAPSAKPLMPLLGSPIRLHVAVPAPGAEGALWSCVDLN